MNNAEREKLLLNNMPVYDGSDDLSLILSWMDHFKIIMPKLSGSREEKLLLISVKLRGDAMTWYAKFLATADEKSTDSDLSDMLTSFRAYFLPANFQQMLLNQLAELSQTTSVNAYNRSFDRLVNQLDNPNPAHLLATYIQGLKRDMRIHVVAKEPRGFIEAQRYADILDMASFGAPLAMKVFAGTRTQPSYRSSMRETPPKRTRINALPQSQGPRGPRGPRRVLRCYLCQEEGHMVHQCSKLRDAQAAIKSADLRDEEPFQDIAMVEGPKNW